MVYDAIQQNAIHALVVKSQIFGVTLDQFEPRMLFATELDELGANVEADRTVPPRKATVA